MKKLMTAPVAYVEFSGYAMGEPEESILTESVPFPEKNYDWRAHLKAVAKEKKWLLLNTHQKTIKSAIAFLAKKGLIDLQNKEFLDDRWNIAFNLPEGSVVIGNADGEPILAVWEEDYISEHCLNCCQRGRKLCEGKSQSDLLFFLRTDKPDCYEDCPDECPYNPEECQFCFDYPPDDIPEEDWR